MDEALSNALINILNSLNKTQQEISISLKLLARIEVEKRCSSIFKKDFEYLIYQLSDGKRPTTEIAKYVPVSYKTISRLWKKWEEFGIMETEGSKKPYRAKYSLEELALNFGIMQNNESLESESDEE